ncbi:hypothetical protein Tco_1303306 [Tanacetum coccineum]
MPHSPKELYTNTVDQCIEGLRSQNSKEFYGSLTRYTHEIVSHIASVDSSILDNAPKSQASTPPVQAVAHHLITLKPKSTRSLKTEERGSQASHTPKEASYSGRLSLLMLCLDEGGCIQTGAGRLQPVVITAGEADINAINCSYYSLFNCIDPQKTKSTCKQKSTLKERPRADSEEESSKKQKLEEDNDDTKKEELRDSMDVSSKRIADGSSKNYKIFSEMLNDFDRQDVIDLHRLVNERYEITSLEDMTCYFGGLMALL